jgi:hypothetical protein
VAAVPKNVAMRFPTRKSPKNSPNPALAVRQIAPAASPGAWRRAVAEVARYHGARIPLCLAAGDSKGTFVVLFGALSGASPTKVAT